MKRRFDNQIMTEMIITTIVNMCGSQHVCVILSKDSCCSDFQITVPRGACTAFANM